jgi:hypothetical protein
LIKITDQFSKEIIILIEPITRDGHFFMTLDEERAKRSLFVTKSRNMVFRRQNINAKVIKPIRTVEIVMTGSTLFTYALVK